MHTSSSVSDQTTTDTASVPQRKSYAGTWVAIILVLAATAVVTTLILLPHEEPEPEPVAPRIVNVEVETLAPVPSMPDTFRLSAVVEPYRVVNVAAEVGARADRWGPRDVNLPIVVEGDPVKAGDVILSLRPDLFKAQRDRVAAELDYQQREYERIRGLYALGNTSQTEMDNVRSTRDMKVAELAEKQYQLDRTVIVAPIDGILNEMLVEVGEFAMAGQPVAEIVDLSRVNVVVNVPERDVSYFTIGDQAQVIVHNAETHTYTGTIAYISELADELTRTSRMEIVVDNTERRLRSGQIVRAELTRQTLKDVLLVPLRAVIPLEEGHVVYVVDKESRAKRVPIELGFILGQQVQIRSGLSAGDRLIVEGHRYVGPGQRVKIVSGQSADPNAADQSSEPATPSEQPAPSKLVEQSQQASAL